MAAGSASPDRWLRVRALYQTSGLWDRGGLSIDPTDLPISDELRAALASWCAWYDRCHQESLLVFDYRAFSVAGEEIARALKMALPLWTVRYFDLALAVSLLLESDLSAGIKSVDMYEIDIRSA